MAKTEKETRDIAREKGTEPRRIGPFDEIDRLFDAFTQRGWLSPFQGMLPEYARPFLGRTPRVDVIDRDQEVILRAELPGVNKQDIDISMTDGDVTISASTSFEKKEEEGDYYRSEMSHGRFSRKVHLPAAVDEEKTRAKFENGILELAMPKREAAKRRSIKVE